MIMKRLKLNQGRHTLVDNKDFEYLNQWKWYYGKPRLNGYTGYAQRRVGNTTYYLHRVILGAKKGQVVDHINGKGLDNQRKNIRLCSQSSNVANSAARRTSKSGYKGVCKPKGRTLFWATITVRGKQKYLGAFVKPEDAAKRYNEEALKQFGKYAYLNKI